MPNGLDKDHDQRFVGPDPHCLQRLSADADDKESIFLLYDIASGSEVTPCNKVNKPQVVYRFWDNVLTSIKTLRT